MDYFINVCFGILSKTLNRIISAGPAGLPVRTRCGELAPAPGGTGGRAEIVPEICEAESLQISISRNMTDP